MSIEELKKQFIVDDDVLKKNDWKRSPLKR